MARKPQTPKGKKGKGPNVVTPSEGPRRTNPDAISVEGKVVAELTLPAQPFKHDTPPPPRIGPRRPFELPPPPRQ